MTPDILIAREEGGYRILFGLLHLTSALTECGEVLAEALEEGPLKIVRTPSGLRVDRHGQYLPILRA